VEKIRVATEAVVKLYEGLLIDIIASLSIDKEIVD
jgi:hypothetical protein